METQRFMIVNDRALPGVLCDGTSEKPNPLVFASAHAAGHFVSAILPDELAGLDLNYGWHVVRAVPLPHGMPHTHCPLCACVIIDDPIVEPTVRMLGTIEVHAHCLTTMPRELLHRRFTKLSDDADALIASLRSLDGLQLITSEHDWTIEERSDLDAPSIELKEGIGHRGRFHSVEGARRAALKLGADPERINVIGQVSHSTGAQR